MLPLIVVSSEKCRALLYKTTFKICVELVALSRRLKKVVMIL